MASPTELMIDGFGRVREESLAVLDGLTREDLRYRVAERANPVGWIVWHLTRVQDDHVAGVADREQCWTSQGWDERFALPYERGATGYGQRPEDVDRMDVDGSLLRGYLASVHDATVAFLEGVSEKELDRVVDTRWDPPVTMGVRLMSVLSDDLQHVGQAAYVRGILEGG